MRAGRPVVAALAAVLVLSACTRGTKVPSPSGGKPGSTPSPLVDPDDILPGGPPPDGIPPIDDPKFLAVADVGFLAPKEPVISVEVGGEAKAYPLRILIWHEIVNDTIGGRPVTVTYCPLCNTGIAFRRPVIGGELLDFGTSGKLYHSNLVMYDRQTESYWPQALGLAVTGPLTGTQLEFVPAQILAWQDWQAAHPDGLVLSEQTGFAREYGTNPYENYDRSASPFLFSGEPDRRLPPLARVLGVANGGALVAFPYDALRGGSVDGSTAIEATVGGDPVVVFWKRGTVSAVNAVSIPDSADVGSATAFGAKLGSRTLTFDAAAGGFVDEQTGSTWDISGQAVSGPLAGRALRPVVAVDSFWFDWAAFHPQTTIFGR